MGFRLPDLEGLGLRDLGSGRIRVWGLGYLGVGVRRVNDYLSSPHAEICVLRVCAGWKPGAGFRV